MKCRRKKFNHFKAPTEYFWDRATQRVVAVGRTGMKTRSFRSIRRHSANAIERARKQRRSKDSYIDKLIELERDAAGQATRVGDKFRFDQ